MASRVCYALAALSVLAGTQGLWWPVAALLSGIFGVIGRRIRASEEHLAQRERNDLANDIATYCAVGKPFFFYLRPFALDQILPVQNPKWRGAAVLPGSHEPREIPLEHLLMQAVEPYGTLVGLGKATTDGGAGKVATSDDSWEERFMDLSNRALALVVVPGSRPGIVREITSLRERGLLGKCLFVCPGTERHRKYWTEASEILHQSGLFLPEYLDELTFMAFNDDGSHVYSEPIRFRPVATIARLLADVAATRPLSEDERRWFEQPARVRRRRLIAAGALVVVAIGWWNRPVPPAVTPVVERPATPTASAPVDPSWPAAALIDLRITDDPAPSDAWPAIRVSASGRSLGVPFPPTAVRQTDVDLQATAPAGHRILAAFTLESSRIELSVAVLEGQIGRRAVNAHREGNYCSVQGWLPAGRDTWRETCFALQPSFPGVPGILQVETLASVNGTLLSLSASASERASAELARVTSAWLAKIDKLNRERR